MKKTFFLILLILLSGSMVMGGCGDKEEEVSGEPEYAGSIVETAITSLCNGDFEKHRSVFTEETADLLSEEGFLEGYNFITGRIGTYISKTYDDTENENGYTVVYYDAEFTDETVPVQIRGVFENDGGEMKLAGFWLNSPKLLEGME
jgi:hypothetical protein